MSDTRAVSTTLSYVLTLGIAALLVTGLITAGGNYVGTEREQVIRDELTVIGQQLAADVERADRLVRAGEASSVTLRINQSFSDSVTGTTYRINLENSPDRVVVESTDPEISIAVEIQSGTDLAESTASGGPVRIVYDDGSDRLEVQNV